MRATPLTGNTMMKAGISRRAFLGATAVLGCTPPVWANIAVPTTARIVVGIPPGGPGDLLARTLAERMGAYAPTIVVDNRPGGATQIAISAVRNGPSDGSQLLLTPSSPLSLYPSTYKTLPYDPKVDFTPVASVGSANHGMAIGPMVPDSVATLADYVAWAKKNPAQANFGSSAAGSIPHLLGAAVAYYQHAPMTHVPYKGSTPGVQDLLGGQISAMFSPVGFFLPYLQAGTKTLRVLAVSGSERSRFLPEIPTFREQGIPVTAREWYGIFLPSKAPRELAPMASEAIRGALADGYIASLMEKSGFDIAYDSATTLAKLLATDTDEWTRVVKTLGFSFES